MIIVENGCVHQHFNASDTEDLVSLVMKAKPLFLFMHCRFRRLRILPRRCRPAGIWEPPTDL